MGVEPGRLARHGAHRGSENRESRGHKHGDIANPETPTGSYDCGHIGTSHADWKAYPEGGLRLDKELIANRESGEDRDSLRREVRNPEPQYCIGDE